jgi:hypothetical protein
MPSYFTPLDPPVEGLTCRHCTDPIMATGIVRSCNMTLSGLREYRWVHAHGSDVCRPTTTAQPFDGWRATSHVEGVLRAREAAEDALIDAMKEKTR